MKYAALSPIQTDISDLFPEILNLFKNIESLEKVRDYQENKTHNEESRTDYVELMKRHYWKVSKANLQIFKLPEEIKEKVLIKFDWLKDLDETPNIGLQLMSGGSILLPHKDENRSSSIIVSVNDEKSFTEFYQEKILENQLVPNPDNIILKQTCCFGIGENWLFDNQQVHSVRLNQPIRINISIGFNKIDFKTLCRYALDQL
jgi:hypothetical protein